MTLRRIQLPKAFTVITTLMVGSDITSARTRCLFWMRFRSGASPRLRPVSLIACALLTILLSCWLPSSPAPVSSIPLLFKVLLGPRAEDGNLSAPLGWNGRRGKLGESHTSAFIPQASLKGFF